MEQKGLVGTLFDLSFSSFITTKIIRVLYAIGIVVAALLALGTLLGGFASDGGGAAILGGVILAPIVFFFAVLAVRVYMEVIIVLFKIAENTSAIAQHVTRGEDPG
jgi:hypothetical protein